VDIISTGTTSSVPVFTNYNVKSGVYINAVGAYKPNIHEIPVETIKRSKIIVDSIKACLKEAGNIIIPLKNGQITADVIHAEIGEIAAGKKVGRYSDSEITLFKSVGNAVQDLAVASIILQWAKNLGTGKLLEL
jgi:ornithine cyclodeaminase/alanine dehydrogenase-like protein (mu-crystallin family)